MKIKELTPGFRSGSMTEFYLHPEKILSFIDEHCKEISNDISYANKFLYRGEADNNRDVYLAKSKIDRMPKDTSAILQVEFDKILKSQGFTALRSNSIFCTSDYTKALEYGFIYYIFPIDGFTYTWSGMQSDWVLSNDDFSFEKYNINSFIFKIWSKTKPEIYDKVWEMLKKLMFVFDRHSERLFSFNKLVENFDTLKSFAIEFKNHPEYFPENSRKKMFDDILNLNINKDQYEKDFIIYHRIKNDHIDQVLRSGHEIYIHGMYLAVKSNVEITNMLRTHFDFQI